KKADKSSVQAGDMLTYTLTVTNGGPDTAQNVVLNDVIPPAMSAAEYSANDGVNWVPLNGPLALGNMNSGAEYKILIHGTVDKAATGQIVNTASVSSSTADPNPGGNTVSVITPIVTPPIIVPPPPPTSSAYVSVIKTANKTSAAPCEQVIYTITVSNAGPSEAEETALTDIMPRELLSAVYSTDSGTTWNTWNGSLTLGTLPAGARIVILIKALIIPGDACYISNVAEISSKTADSSPAPGSKRSEAVVAVKRSHCCGSGLQMPARGRNGYATAWWS
ncbi:MAG: DUF11 domain-containing protein, partial [Clostridiales bacterium]|nr:DUF11 domain-containing protein [Clostridiales bacterium]